MPQFPPTQADLLKGQQIAHDFLHHRIDTDHRAAFFGEQLGSIFLGVLGSHERVKTETPKHLKYIPAIQTVSGGYFNFMDPDASVIHPEDIAHALSRIARFNGHTLGNIPYNVAQHSVHACEQALPGYKFEALMHDAPEYVLGDVASPLKQLLPDYHRLEQIAHTAIARKFDLPVLMSEEVKLVDTRMLVTEKRDLMPVDPPGSGIEWDALKHCKPYDFTVNPWTPSESRDRWLELFFKYKDERRVSFNAAA